MSSIADVAKLANVSTATASRALSGKSTVTAATRAKVLAAAKKLDYTPNAAAKSLRMNRSSLLGLIVPDIENPFYSTLAKHVGDHARRLEYNIVLCNTGFSNAVEKEFFDLLVGGQVAGLLLCRTDSENPLYPQKRQGSKFPVVVMDRVASREEESFVTVNNTRVGKIAARHLLGLGHRRFACVAEHLNHSVVKERIEEFARSVDGSFLEQVLTVDEGFRGAKAAAAKLLVQPKSKRPTAFYCTNDMLALGVIQAAQECGMRVPDDVSVMGTDGIFQGEFFSVPLTTVSQPFDELARLAVKTLLDIIENPHPHTVGLAVEPALTIRKSTGPVGQGGRK
ncbi:MAG: LacI family transcriptional regulator [Planctomycetes bacterium]|nr:LacI family transcriptional regulator [Planctomycetota bacterium]MCD7898085.1 LacI family transcriptional regulator [Planctomycetaceae bacterium]